MSLKKWKQIDQQVQKLAEKFERTCRVKPEIFHFDMSDGEIQLCAKVVKSGGTRTAKRPYMNARIKVPDFVW